MLSDLIVGTLQATLLESVAEDSVERSARADFAVLLAAENLAAVCSKKEGRYRWRQLGVIVPCTSTMTVLDTMDVDPDPDATQLVIEPASSKGRMPQKKQTGK